MKFSIQFITSMILAGYIQAAELPFQELLTPDEVREYNYLRGFMDPADLRALIQGELEENGRFNYEVFQDEPVRHGEVFGQPQPVHDAGGRDIPYAHLLSPEQLQDIYQIRDFLDEEGLLEAVRDALGDAFPGDYAGEGHAHHHGEHHGDYQAHEGDFQDHEGHFQEHLGGFQDPTKLQSDADFEAYLANPDNFTIAAMNLMFSEGDLNSLTDNRQIKMILAAASHDEPLTFQLLVGSFNKTLAAADSDDLNFILMEITQPWKDKRFLEVLLKDCDHRMARDVGMYMHAGNSKFHQIFMDKCSSNIDYEIGRNLVNVKVPKSVRDSWNETKSLAKSSFTVNMVPVNPGGQPDSGATLVHQVGKVQVAGFFTKPEVLKKHPELHKVSDVKAIQKILEPIAKSEHFCVIHLDFDAGKATIFRSFDPAGPGIGIIHVDEIGGGTYSDGLCELYVQKRKSWIHSEEIHPKDVIIGLSEEHVSTLKNGFKTDILGSLSMCFGLDSAESVLNDVVRIAVSKKTHHVMVGTVPELKAFDTKKKVKEEKWAEEKVRIDPVTQTTTITHTEHSEKKSPSGETMVFEETITEEHVGTESKYEASNEAIENWRRIEETYADDMFEDDPDIELGHFDDDDELVNFDDEDVVSSDDI